VDIRIIPVEQAWLIRHQVMWPEKDIEFVKLSDDKRGVHYGLFLHDRLVSVVSLFVDKEEAQFRKFATLQEEQGKGYGSALLHHVFAMARNEGVKRIWCNARAGKAAFYEKFGLCSTGEAFEKAGIPYVIMEAMW
jgi:GNAT superfamily N-acetyltransferase